MINFNRSMRFLYLLKSKLKQSELGIVVCFLVLQSSALCCITLGSSEPRAPSPHFQRVLIRNSGEIGRLLFLLVIRMSNFTKTFSHPFQTKQTTHNKKTTANHNWISSLVKKKIKKNPRTKQMTSSHYTLVNRYIQPICLTKITRKNNLMFSKPDIHIYKVFTFSRIFKKIIAGLFLTEHANHDCRNFSTTIANII